MKLKITEEQKKYLEEQQLMGYSPEKIDEFVVQGNKDLKFFQDAYQKFYNKMMGVSVHEAFENINELKTLLDNIKSAEVRSNDLATKYYNIVDKYDFLDYPQNVKELEDVYNKLENLSYDIGSVKDIVEAVYDSVEHFIKWNNSRANE